MTNVDPPINGTTAPLRNVALFQSLVQEVVNRPRHLPGMATFHGFSGYGKTKAATYAANKFRAYYIEVGESWTKRKFIQALATELGLDTRGTVADLVDKIIAQLVITDRPIIIDEFDHVVRRRYHEVIREIHDKSDAPMLLIGEELLPQLLQASERFHNRMINWVPAQPSDGSDAAQLAQLFAPEIALADDLAAQVAETSAGQVRRIAVNIERIRQEAAINGWEMVDAATWGGRELFAGRPPARRQ